VHRLSFLGAARGGALTAVAIAASIAVAIAWASLALACGGHDSGGGGTCGRTCPGGTVCERGACVVVCDQGTADCNGMTADGCEVEVTTDVDHCGACDAPCAPDHATGACSGGACAIDVCADGFADCDHAADTGCEQDIAGDVAHCGGCDVVCPTGPRAAPTCTGGHCGLTCEDGFGDCDGDPTTGCEVELATDPAHCGSCEHACAANETCGDRTCAPLACSAPLADCDGLAATGCEIDTATDDAHCGTCDHACPAGATCSDGACSFACGGEVADPITGQRCPIATPCTLYAECGTQLGAPDTRYWYCSPTLHTCQYLPLSGGFTSAGGTCTGQLVVRELSHAPWDKRIVPPDGVAFRAGTTLAIEVTNTTAADLYLDQLPLTLELAGSNPSRFDVAAIQLYQVGNLSDYGDGNNATQFVCSSPQTPFAGSATFTLGTGATGGCGGSFFSRVRPQASTRFVINLAFAAGTTFIDGRQYRLRIGSPLVGVRARPSATGAASAVTACTLPAAGITGAYLSFEQP
jgi:hypothetical protein